MFDFDEIEEAEDELRELEERHRKKRIAFVDFWKGFLDCTDRWISMQWFEENLLNVEVVHPHDNPDVIMFSLFGNQHSYFASRGLVKLVFFTGENVRPPVHEVPLCLSFDHVDSLPPTVHTRLPLWVLNREAADVVRLHECRLRGEVDHGVYLRPGFCSWVASNASRYDASVRLDFVELLSRTYQEVACGGEVRNNVGGPVEDKQSFLRGYRFHVAFENASQPGYCTEKLLHAFAAGCLPIYWGDPHIARGAGGVPDFNPEALISAHDFDSFEALAAHVAAVDQDPRLFEAYLRQPILSPEWYERLRDRSRFQARLTDVIFHDCANYKRRRRRRSGAAKLQESLGDDDDSDDNDSGDDQFDGVFLMCS